ncbi:MAG: hypothetical protein ACFCU6_16300 [Balneolaceae bacterium]
MSNEVVFKAMNPSPDADPRASGPHSHTISAYKPNNHQTAIPIQSLHPLKLFWEHY